MSNAVSNDKRKVLSMVAHASALFSWSLIWLGVPLALIALVDDEVVKANACEALNYGIAGFIFVAVFIAFAFVTFGLGLFLLIPLIPILVLMTFLPVIGMVKVAMDPESVYYYPLVPRMIRYRCISKSPE
jgi:uncharacterized protein